MFCEQCKKRPATVFYTEILDKRYSQVNLCQECAQDKGINLSPLKSDFSLADFLEGAVQGGENKTDLAEDWEKSSLVCPQCGITYGEFKREGFFGCAECYSTFRKQLVPLFKQIHGASKHFGSLKVETEPASRPSAPVQIDEIGNLKAALERAVARERFEEAARLRDQLKSLLHKDGPHG